MVKATVAHRQQNNEAHSEQCQIYENADTIDEALKHQVINSTKDTYITELCNKYTGLTGVKGINLIHHLMEIYGK